MQAATWSLLAPRPADRFHYNVFNVAEDDLARIQDLLATTFREIRAIVAASPSADHTLLFVSHLCALEPAP